ncbi:hypothetical protein ACUODF_54550, partial [Escherichia coli]
RGKRLRGCSLLLGVKTFVFPTFDGKVFISRFFKKKKLNDSESVFIVSLTTYGNRLNFVFLTEKTEK